MIRITGKTISDDPVALKYTKDLTAYRARFSLTQKELAKIVGVSATLISYYERGEHPMPVELYNKLAAVFRWSRYRQGLHETLTLDFDDTQLDFDDTQLEKPKRDVLKHDEPKHNEATNKGFITEKQLDDLQTIAGIKGCSMSELLDKLIAPYSDALKVMRNL